MNIKERAYAGGIESVLRMLQELAVIAHAYDEALEGDIAQAIVKAKQRASTGR